MWCFPQSAIPVWRDLTGWILSASCVWIFHKIFYVLWQHYRDNLMTGTQLVCGAVHPHTPGRESSCQDCVCCGVSCIVKPAGVKFYMCFKNHLICGQAYPVLRVARLSMESLALIFGAISSSLTSDEVSHSSRELLTNPLAYVTKAWRLIETSRSLMKFFYDSFFPLRLRSHFIEALLDQIKRTVSFWPRV